MEFILIILFAFIVFNLSRLGSMKPPPSTCKPHTWRYNEEGRMQCQECRKYPLED